MIKTCLSFLLFGMGILFAQTSMAEVTSEAAVVGAFQKKPGFVGYIPAGLSVEVKKINLESQKLTVLVSEDQDAGLLIVTFKNFEKAIGGGKKVEYLHRVDPLVGRTFKLKYNLLLLALK